MRASDQHPPATLIAEIASQCGRSVPADTALLADDLKSRYGESLVAIVLYGSCMRTHNYTEGVVDLYVIVDSYKGAYRERLLQLLNFLLPPNVFYLEVAGQTGTIRVKYAVISVSDLKRGCTHWFHSYIWSRFAQPVRILFARDWASRNFLYNTFANAVLTFLRSTIPTLTRGRLDAEAIWTNGLALTYAAELRPERQTRARYITHQNLGDFIRLTHSAAPVLMDLIQVIPQGYYACIVDEQTRKRASGLWRVRRWQGRILSVLRLMKAVFTFRDCVNYAAWKIKRHTGISVKVTPGLQRHPILFGFSVLWQLIRRDALR